MKAPRRISEEHLAELKAATKRAVQIAGGPVSFAFATRVEAPALSKYVGRDYADAFMPVDVVADLEADIGAPLVTEHLARLSGYRLVRAGEGAGADTGRGLPDIGLLARIAKEANDVVQAMAEAAEDGRYDAAEIDRVMREIDENVAVLRRAADRVWALRGGR